MVEFGLTPPIGNDWLQDEISSWNISNSPYLPYGPPHPCRITEGFNRWNRNYHGSAQFQFSLEDANGTEHWRNGVDANESIRVFVVNGHYSVMLGGQGMNPLPPELFLQHEELYLSVSFDKGDGPRTLGPEQLITATPRALVAEVAKIAEVAKMENFRLPLPLTC